MRPEEVPALLEQPLQDPEAILGALLSTLADGSVASELWLALQDSAERSGKQQALAAAYDAVTAPGGIDLLSPSAQSHVLLMAARAKRATGEFSAAGAYIERIMELAPGDEAEHRAEEELLELYDRGMRDKARAMERAERLLARDPSHVRAREVAESCLERRSLAPRAAAVLAGVYDAAGKPELVAAMHARELSSARGERRLWLQRRLAVLRQDIMADPAGALDLLKPVVAASPADDDARERLVKLSLALDRGESAVRILLRALVPENEAMLRAKVAVQVGQVLLRSGQVKRAEGVFEQALAIGGDEASRLAAARELAEIHAKAGRPTAASRALEIVVTLESDREIRMDAARRLARLCEGDSLEPRRAAQGWLALLDSPWFDEAIARLESLADLEPVRSAVIESLAALSASETDPVRSKALLVLLAQLRAAGRDTDGAVEVWRQIVKQSPNDRESLGELIALCERERRWEPLGGALEIDVELAPEEERAQLLTRLGAVQTWHLDDPKGAVESFARALESDPDQQAARQGLEHLLVAPGARLEAAVALEKLYRRIGAKAELCRVMEVRAEVETELTRRLSALAEAAELAATGLGHPRRALALAGRALREAVRGARDAVPVWVGRVEDFAQRAMDFQARAELLGRALAQSAVDCPELVVLARATASALSSIGDQRAALEVLEPLQVSSSSADLDADIASLRGLPPLDERIRLLEAELERETDPETRRSLLHTLAHLQVRLQGGAAAAIATWGRVRDECPADWVAHQALIQAELQVEALDRAEAELARAVGSVTGELQILGKLQLAELLARSGKPNDALKLYRELLGVVRVPEEFWSAVERLAAEQADTRLVAEVLERRVAVLFDPVARATLLARLGDVLGEQLGAEELAVARWLEAAQGYEGDASDLERAARLYDRVLKALPGQRVARERLLELWARSGRWDELKALALEWLGEGTDAGAVRWLLGLEALARAGGGAERFADLVSAAADQCKVPRVVVDLRSSVARVLASDPHFDDRVIEIYRDLLGQDAASDTLESDYRVFLGSRPAGGKISLERRWLMRRRSERAPTAVARLIAWAEMERSEFQDPQAAVQLYEQALKQDADRVDVLIVLWGLYEQLGSPEASLRVATELRARSEGELRNVVDVAVAGLLMEKLGRPVEALEAIESLIRVAPVATEALRIVHLGLAHDNSRQLAASLLERATETVDDPEARAEVLQLLLETSASIPGFEQERARWYLNLVDCSVNSPEAGLATALRAAEELPDRMELWERAEGFARDLGAPQPVADAYARALHDDLPVSTAEALGRRMVDFHEEWFNEPERVVSLLQRVLELAPGASWAFDRLKLEFNGSGRWEELFRLYDRAIAQAETDAAQADLLREVAMAAKDFAGDSERAIQYLVRLHSLVPTDARVEGALERLYERGGHAEPLIQLLTKRIPSSDEHTARSLKLRIAGLRLDVGQPLEVLALIDELLESGGTRGDVALLLERLVVLPASRDSMVPRYAAKKGIKPKRIPEISVRERAANHLRDYYDSEGRVADVVRMLEVLVEVADEPSLKAERLRHTVDVRLKKLGDHPGAFDNMLKLVALEPDVKEHRRLLGELAREVGGYEQQTELLVSLADSTKSPRLQVRLLGEAAIVLESSQHQTGAAIELYLRVLGLAEHDEGAALEAARALDELLKKVGRHDERCSVLERRAALESEPEARSAALGEAARVAFSILNDPARAVSNWQARLADDAEDLEALDGLIQALERARRWGELVSVLQTRAGLLESKDAARGDRVRVARILAEQMHARDQAIAAWTSVRELHGRDEETFVALRELLYLEQRWSDLASLLTEEASAESDGSRQAEVRRELGELHRSRTGDVRAALAAYVGAGDWERAIQVSATANASRELGREVCASLLELAVTAWNAAPQEQAEGPQVAASWAIDELATRLLEDGLYEEVVELLIRGTSLPFSQLKKRQLKRDAAILCSDRLKQPGKALAFFGELLGEDPGDGIAAETVPRFAALLEQQGDYPEIARLWEDQARSSAQRGDGGTAAAHWVRAAQVWEKRVGNIGHALVDYEQGAALGGVSALEAVARIHTEAGRHRDAAQALEILVERSPREKTAQLALRLADTYVAAGAPAKARAALESAADIALDASALRRKLLELYRDARDWTRLADTLVSEAGRLSSGAERIRYLRQAADVHFLERKDPTAAVPLLAKAVGLAPADAELRLALADVLCASERFPEAVLVLREQLENYGARKPKDRALVHHALALALLSKGERADARIELEAANRINPAHPGVLRALARIALEDGELARAEQTYRALLLVLPPAESSRGPSRAEALFDLSEVAQRQGDAVRAQEFEESAFEAALESRGEAACLEVALARRDRHDLLARLLEVQLETARSAPETVRALAALTRLYADRLGGVGPIEQRVRQRVALLYEQLKVDAVEDEEAWVALGQVFGALGDEDAEVQVLEKQVEALLQRGTKGTRDAGPFYRLAEVQIASPATHQRGLELLQVAMDLRAEPVRAARMMRTAVERELGGEQAVLLYEQVARQSGDAALLADALLRAVQLPGDRGDSLREGVRIAQELGNVELVEKLLRAALGNQGIAWLDADAAWARMRLADVLEARGEYEASMDLQRAAVKYLSPEEQRAVLLRIAAFANERLEEPRRAASLYEELLALDPCDRQIWEPLLGLYRRLGESARLVRLIDQTVPVVETIDDRSRLRVEQAHLLLDQKQSARAIELLEETLADDPDNEHAADVLAEVLETQGRMEDLVRLLAAQLDREKSRQARDEIGRLSRRIGALLEQSGRSDEALGVYRSWLEWDGDNIEALRAVLRTAEATADSYLVAEALEDLLRVERGAAALQLSQKLAAIRGEQGDEPGVERAWRLGFTAAPEAVELRDMLLGRLEAREEWAEVGEILEVALLNGAAEPVLLRRLVTAHERAGQYEQALAVLARIPGVDEREDALLRKNRARLLRELRRDEEALAELEQAYALDRADSSELVAALEQVLLSADLERRHAVLARLAELRMVSGDQAAAKQHLTELVREFPGDVAALRQLAALAEADSDVTLAISVYEQLTGIETGQELLHAALRLADLAKHVNAFDQARAGLERAFAAFPGEPTVLARLREVYVQTGASLQLAEMLLRDAEQVADPEKRLTLLLEGASLLLASAEGRDRAMEVLAAARAIAPDNVELGVLLARALDESGKTDEALSQLGSILQAHRGRRIKTLAPAYEEISRIQLREGFISDALESLSRAFDMDLRNGALAMRLGRLALESDNKEVALRAFRAVSMMRTADDGSEGATSYDKADAYYQLARMAAEEGDGRKAKILISKALAERADHPEANTLLGQL